jgi:hypothetical protein
MATARAEHTSRDGASWPGAFRQPKRAQQLRLYTVQQLGLALEQANNYKSN